MTLIKLNSVLPLMFGSAIFQLAQRQASLVSCSIRYYNCSCRYLLYLLYSQNCFYNELFECWLYLTVCFCLVYKIPRITVTNSFHFWQSFILCSLCSLLVQADFWNYSLIQYLTIIQQPWKKYSLNFVE